ncbi:MFS transporter [Bacillus sp. DJP31]|uniref:MFS transporter n=1 Tax=Bacillus sp. DJP31 TaxID=3409789 RepID=UPI003BB70998
MPQMNGYRIALLLILAGVFVASNIYTLIPIYQVVAVDLETSSSMIVWGSMSFMFCYAIGLLVFGTLSDYHGWKIVFVIGMLLFSITSFLVALSNSAEFLVLTRGLQGFAGGSFAPIAFAYTFDLYHGKFRALVLSLINTGFLVAGIAGLLISSSITGFWEWEYIYYLFGLVYFIIFLLFLKMLPNRMQPKVQGTVIPIKQYLQFFRSKDLVFCYTITFSLLLTMVAFYDTVGRFLLPTHSETDLFNVRLIGLTGAVLSLFGGTIISKVGIKGSLYLGFSLLIGSLLFMILFPFYEVILYSSIFIVASISILIPSIITIIGTLGSEARGSAVAFYSFTLLVGASFGSLLTSMFEFQGVLLFLLIYGAVNIFLTTRLSHK